MGDVDGAPVPDALDGVLEVAAMEAVFAAQRMRRVDVMRRELLVEAEGRGLGVTEVDRARDPAGAGRRRCG